MMDFHVLLQKNIKKLVQIWLDQMDKIVYLCIWLTMQSIKIQKNFKQTNQNLKKHIIKLLMSFSISVCIFTSKIVMAPWQINPAPIIMTALICQDFKQVYTNDRNL